MWGSRWSVRVLGMSGEVGIPDRWRAGGGWCEGVWRGARTRAPQHGLGNRAKALAGVYLNTGQAAPTDAALQIPRRCRAKSK